MKIKDIAEKHHVSIMMVSFLIRNERKTTNHKLAIEIAKKTGLSPIDHISPRFRDMYLRLYPELNEVPTNNGG